MSSKRRYDTQIMLTPFDDLFSTQEEREDSGLEKVKMLPLSELHPFPNHPFSVRDDEDMQKLVDSIKENGVMVPAIVRPRAEGGYEMISGHRRMHASARANLKEMPVLMLDRIARFFPQNATSEQIADQILHMLELHCRNRNRGGSER